jgi:hypothetical protein
MINKLHFQSIISKYHLKGLVESVRWDIKDQNLKIIFINANKDMVGELESSNFPTKDALIAIYNTSQLLKLINITSGDLILDLIQKGGVFTKFNIADKQFNLNYSLSDLSLVYSAPKVDEPEQYDIEIKLDNEHLSPLIKAKEALGDTDKLFICSHVDLNQNKDIEFSFGEDNEYSNKISYFIPSSDIKFNYEKDFKICFDSNTLKEILSVNKENSSSKMYLSLEGLLKIEFEGENIKNRYFLLQKTS